MPEASSLTPMLRHYLEVKAEHPDALLLYRMGDFFELFFEDAEIAAPLLEVALTARHKGSENEAPMCGVPYRALESYVAKLMRLGYKVAICDQVEDASEASGLVKREVTRVMTPGTLSEPELLEGKEENLLVSLVWEDGGGTGAGAFLELSTGNFFVRRWDDPGEALDDLRLLAPREAIVADSGLPETLEAWIEEEAASSTRLDETEAARGRRATELLQRQLGTGTLKGFGLEDGEPAVDAAASAVAYARDTQKNDLSHIRTLAVREGSEVLVLDATTLENLEVLRNLREGGRRGSLLSVVDRTVTAPGGRLLKDWLRRPLADPERIVARHEAVAALLGDGAVREELRARLAEVGDPERLATRAVLGSLGPREAASLREALNVAPEVLALVAGLGTPLLEELSAVDPQAGLADDLERTLAETPAATLADGGVIAEGVDEELDSARSLARDSKEHILALQAREREATGIDSLKVRYNKVFGYFIEVTKANLDAVPERYIRKQTLANSERYFTPEVKELEEKILSAEATQLDRETELFGALRERIAKAAPGIRDLTQALAAADVLASFADVAARRGYRRPRIDLTGAPIHIEAGRHPVVEALAFDPFVPNDVELDDEEHQIVVLTGPNMGGKSTYLRQVALIVLLAQAGSFVPAESAEIGVVDRIFTRVGASDDLARGESTFMVEMIEASRILNLATDRSLVILDEVGRGTATFDGLSLAWAIVEYLHEHRRPKTLFATHYHELTELAGVLPRVVNRTMAAKEWEEKIVFLRRVVPGSADRSYGIHVARLAGLPDEVTERAGEVLRTLESQEYDLKGRPRLAQGGPGEGQESQLPLFVPPPGREKGESPVLERLRDVDLDTLSPLEALNLLAELKKNL